MIDDFKLIAPAPPKLWREIHMALAEEGQALRPEESAPFAIIRRDGEGRLTAAASGEISFRSLHISHLFVASPLRRRGVGASLLSAVEAYSRARQCERLHLETRSGDALRFYRRHGFEIFGELPRYAGEQSLYFLQKRL
ncbi:MAG: GNAT family N-acetyltransferase [Rhodobacteraceae bacterium]|nr:GNAT family N-acetyltransferase [Paracoccaceae bacterium]